MKPIITTGIFLLFGTVMSCSSDSSLHSASSLHDQHLLDELSDDAAVRANEESKAKQVKEDEAEIVIPTKIVGAYLFCQRQASEDIGTLELACYAGDSEGMVLDSQDMTPPKLLVSFQRSRQDEELTASLINEPGSIFAWTYISRKFPGGDFSVRVISEESPLVFQDLPEDPDNPASRPEYLRVRASGDNLIFTIIGSFFRNYSESSLAIFREVSSVPQASWLSQEPSLLNLRSCTNSPGSNYMGSLELVLNVPDLALGTASYYIAYLYPGGPCPSMGTPQVDMLIVRINENGQIHTLYAPL